MINRIKLLLTISLLFVSQAQSFGQKPNYSGIWILNLEKSKLQHQAKGLTSSKFIITQDGDKFTLTRYHIFGDKKKKLRFKMLADGKTRKVKILFKAKLEWKDNDLLATLWRKNFSNVVKYRFGNTENEFIADEVFTGKPQNHHNIWVFDKEIPK